MIGHLYAPILAPRAAAAPAPSPQPQAAAGAGGGGRIGRVGGMPLSTQLVMRRQRQRRQAAALLIALQ